MLQHQIMHHVYCDHASFRLVHEGMHNVSVPLCIYQFTITEASAIELLITQLVYGR